MLTENPARRPPRLVVLNGPPASGKSTLASWYVQAHPLALNLDIDQVRAMLGGWRDNAGAAGLHARAIALAAATTHLRSGKDVVVPQYIAAPAFLDQLAAVATAAGAQLHELVLLDDKATALRRFAARTAAARSPQHLDAAEQLSGPDHLADMYDRIVALLPDRPHATVIPVVDGNPSATYAALHAHLTR